MLEPLSAFEYYHLLDARQAPSLVCFTKPKCGGCQRLKRILKEAPLNIPGIRCFEVQVEDSYGLVEELNILHLPAMFLYYKGDLHREIFSTLDTPSLEEAIQHALNSSPMEQR